MQIAQSKNQKIMTTTTPQEVWQLLGELVQAQKETDNKFRETDRQIKELGKQIIEVLKEKLEWCYQHPKELAEMGRAARRRAEQLTWESYRTKLASKVKELLGLSCESHH